MKLKAGTGLFLFVCFIAVTFRSEALADSVSSDKLLTVDTYMEMESIQSPGISPDGADVIFVRSWVDKISDRMRSNLWLASVTDRRIRQFTSGNWRDFSPVWSPDGRKIAFLSDRDEGKTQLFVMWWDTREIVQLTHLERAPGNLAWSPDGRKLAFTCFIEKDEQPLKVNQPPRPKGAKWADPPVIINRLSWRADGRGFLPEGNEHIFVIDALLGGTPVQITSGDYSHGAPVWAADGRKMYFSAIRKPEPEYEFGDSEIYRVELATREITPLTDREGPDRSPAVSPDGRWLAYTGYDEKNFTSHLSSLYVMNSEGGGKRLLAGDLPNSPRIVSWAGDSTGVYFILQARGRSDLYFAPLAGRPKKITDGNHVLSAASISETGTVAGILSTFHRPGFLVSFDLSDPARMSELADFNSDVLEGIKLGQIEELVFKSSDGLSIQGWLIKPARFEQGKKYPMLLWIHGGPWSMYSVAFNWEWQNFAAGGYAVLYINPRGSTGYGQDFVNGIQYAYPGRDYDDLMAGVDAALAGGFIDPDNLFVCGGSGGGVLTAWIVGQTARFRAAVSMRPVINWHSFVGTTDFPSWYRQFVKYPWEDPMEYAKRSPLHYVAKVKTPVMIMTGEADLRTPISQSEEYYRALKMLKKDTLLVRMPEEYHGWRRPSHRLLQQLYLQAWFEKYRKK